ncbi:MAG: cupin domain-containing protein [Rhodocyclaceae bacterium]|nr:MAG: cupin domain-containing protein [Rhodocyclaceae bacterium]
MAKWKRYVVGSNPKGESAVLTQESTMVKEDPGIFYRVELWCTAEMPVDNSITIDRATQSMTRAPVANGSVFRALEIPPDTDDKEKHRAAVAKLHSEVGQKHLPTDAEYKRHPSMHRTDTLDYIACVKGEIWLVTDVDEVLMRPGDTVVIRGTNHAWSNRSNEPCLMIGTMLDAAKTGA